MYKISELAHYLSSLTTIGLVFYFLFHGRSVAELNRLNPMNNRYRELSKIDDYLTDTFLDFLFGGAFLLFSYIAHFIAGDGHYLKVVLCFVVGFLLYTFYFYRDLQNKHDFLVRAVQEEAQEKVSTLTKGINRLLKEAAFLRFAHIFWGFFLVSAVCFGVEYLHSDFAEQIFDLGYLLIFYAIGAFLLDLRVRGMRWGDNIRLSMRDDDLEAMLEARVKLFAQFAKKETEVGKALYEASRAAVEVHEEEKAHDPLEKNT